MNVEIFSVCEAASTDSDGKLSILGGFDHLTSYEVPISYPITVAAKVRFQDGEEGPKNLGFSIIDSDGKAILPLTPKKIPVRIRRDQTSGLVFLSLRIPRVTFRNFGEYSVGLVVDGQMKAEIPFFVLQAA